MEATKIKKIEETQNKMQEIDNQIGQLWRENWDDDKFVELKKQYAKLRNELFDLKYL